MSVAAGRLLDPRRLAAAGVFVVAAMIGALAGLDPKFAIAAALGLAFVLVAVGDLAVGVAVFAVLTYLELAPIGGGPALSFAKLAGLTLAISWIAVIGREQDRRILFTTHPLLTAAFVFFVAWAAISSAWAESPANSWTPVGRYVLNAALLPIIFTAIQQPKHLRWVAGCIVAGAALAAAYGLTAAPGQFDDAANDLNRISGTVGDPNLLAAVLVVGIVIALALTIDASRSAIVRALSFGGALLSMAAMFATVSRGGVVALGAALIAAVALAGPRRAQMTAATLAVVIAAVGYFSLFASQSQVDRLTESDGGSGRTDIWKVGWRMVEANPVKGVGVGNFEVSSIHYLLVEPGALARDEFIVDRPAAAHNMYLEILAELGVVGLALFLTLVGASLWAAVRAAVIFDREGQDGLSLIARAVAVGLISILAADLFLSAEYTKLLWLLIGLGPAALAVAGNVTKARSEGARRSV